MPLLEDYFGYDVPTFDYTELSVDMHQVARGNWRL